METKKKIFWGLALFACLPFTLTSVDAATSSAGSIAGTIQNKSGSSLKLKALFSVEDCLYVHLNGRPVCEQYNTEDIILENAKTIQYSIVASILKNDVHIMLLSCGFKVCDWIVDKSGVISLDYKSDYSRCINNNGNLSIIK